MKDPCLFFDETPRERKNGAMGERTWLDAEHLTKGGARNGDLGWGVSCHPARLLEVHIGVKHRCDLQICPQMDQRTGR